MFDPVWDPLGLMAAPPLPQVMSSRPSAATQYAMIHTIGLEHDDARQASGSSGPRMSRRGARCRRPHGSQRMPTCGPHRPARGRSPRLGRQGAGVRNRTTKRRLLDRSQTNRPCPRGPCPCDGSGTQPCTKTLRAGDTERSPPESRVSIGWQSGAGAGDAPCHRPRPSRAHLVTGTPRRPHAGCLVAPQGTPDHPTGKGRCPPGHGVTDGHLEAPHDGGVGGGPYSRH